MLGRKFRLKRQNSAARQDGLNTTGGGTKEPETPPKALFPLSELLQDLLLQEATLWKKNEGLPTAVNGQ